MGTDISRGAVKKRGTTKIKHKHKLTNETQKHKNPSNIKKKQNTLNKTRTFKQNR